MEHTQTFYLNNDFRTCLYNLFAHGLEAFPRGTTTRELINYNITLQDPRNRVITFPARKTSTKYLLGELIWYFTGSNDPKGILPYAKFWDGIKNSGNMPGYDEGTVNSNYGHRLFGHHNPSLVPVIEQAMTPAGLDEAGNVVIEPHPTKIVTGESQWNAVVNLLKNDRDSRQAIINIHLPADRHGGNKDVACTLTLQFFIRENKLHMIVNMRSNDIILGFTNDVFQFTMLQEAMMLQLRETYPGLDLGFYYHNAGSMHIYDRHFEMAKNIIATENAVDVSMIPMDAFNDDILTGLVGVESAWQAAGAPDDFDFSAVPAWNLLTPYWQTTVKAFFNQDECALHDIFGQDHDHDHA